MILSNLFIAGEPGEKEIRIENEKITAVIDSGADPVTNPGAYPVTDPGGPDIASSGESKFSRRGALSLPGALAFPGLINSHDHLDFNLYPSMGNRIYANYTEWGPDIHAQNHPAIRAVQAIPPALRIRWGLYKNLLNGITTVVNHGVWLDTGDDDLAGAFQDCYSLHSPGFEKNWKWKLNRPHARPWPVVLHVGEGTDETAHREIDRLLRWNLFKKPLIGVHGVAMDERQAARFRALVWCPASNYFLLDRTAAVERLKRKLPVLFGTDSTLTASWNIWEQLRLARKDGQLTDPELLASLTTAPAAVWGLAGNGRLAAGQYADLVIAQPGSETHAGGGVGDGGGSGDGSDGRSLDAFYNLDPGKILLVIRRGAIRLFDGRLLDRLVQAGLIQGDPAHGGPRAEGFSCITVQGNRKYINGDLPGLMAAIRAYHPGVEFPVDG